MRCRNKRLTQDEEIIHTNTCKSTAPLTTKCGSTTPDEESSRPIAVVPTGRKTGAALRLAYASSSVSDLAVARSPNGSTTKRFQSGEALAAWIALRIAKTSKSVSSRAGSIKSERSVTVPPTRASIGLCVIHESRSLEDVCEVRVGRLEAIMNHHITPSCRPLLDERRKGFLPGRRALQPTL